MLEAVQEISPLKQTFSLTIRTAIVLAFLLGMPLVAVPQVAEQLKGLLPKPREQFATPGDTAAEMREPANERVVAQRGTTVTMLADDRPPPLQIRPDHQGLAATIEALKAEFVAAGVTYMVLERVDTGSAQYQFRFDLPVATGSAYRKRFQVVDDAPDEAMRKALADLKQWRVAEREPAHLERPTVMLR